MSALVNRTVWKAFWPPPQFPHRPLKRAFGNSAIPHNYVALLSTLLDYTPLAEGPYTRHNHMTPSLLHVCILGLPARPIRLIRLIWEQCIHHPRIDSVSIACSQHPRCHFPPSGLTGHLPKMVMLTLKIPISSDLVTI